MFKPTQELRLKANSDLAFGTAEMSRYTHNTSSSNSNCNNHIENDCIFGRYQKTPDADSYPMDDHHIFVSPELTDTSKIQLLHFPSGVVKINTDVNFTIKRNGTKGNFEVKLESPYGVAAIIPVKIVDPERVAVSFQLNQSGLYKVHIRCNSVALPKSPFIIASICGDGSKEKRKMQIPIFRSDASKVTSRGLGLSHLYLSEKNEFTVDGTEAGNNMLFVGIFGPQGQCDEVVVKHLGKNLYKVTYEVRDPGDYMLAVKWGDEHIPGSPFYLSAI